MTIGASKQINMAPITKRRLDRCRSICALTLQAVLNVGLRKNGLHDATSAPQFFGLFKVLVAHHRSVRAAIGGELQKCVKVHKQPIAA
jgi:hypothetical protein